MTSLKSVQSNQLDDFLIFGAYFIESKCKEMETLLRCMNFIAMFNGYLHLQFIN